MRLNGNENTHTNEKFTALFSFTVLLILERKYKKNVSDSHCAWLPLAQCEHSLRLDVWPSMVVSILPPRGTLGGYVP